MSNLDNFFNHIKIRVIMKKIILTMLLTLGLFSSLVVTPSNAVQFIENDSTGNINLTDTTKRYENLVTAGQNIDIKAPIYKDIYAAGNNITIDGFIERSAVLAGANITIKNTNIGAGAKLAASNVTLENVKIEEDLFIAAGTVTIKNSVISGDAVITTSNLNLEGSTIMKNMYYSGPVSESLRSQVKGELKLDNKEMANKVMEDKKKEKGLGSFINPFALAQFFSGLAVLGIAVYILKKYNKLHDKTIGFGSNSITNNIAKVVDDKAMMTKEVIPTTSVQGQSLRHMTYGALALLIIPATIIIALVSLGMLAPLALTILGLYILFVLIISPLESYYLSNLIFKDKIQWWHPIVIFIVITLLSVIPFVGGIIGFILFFIGLMNAGYLLSKMYKMKKRELES
jgi:hypothetical protein